MSARAAVIAAALLGMAGAGCDSAAPSDAGSVGTPPPAASASEAPSSPSPRPAASISPAVVATASPTGTGGTPAPGTRIVAGLAAVCARAGVDTQTLIVSGAEPDGFVGYSTEYSDHSTEVDNESYTGGYGVGRADASGEYRASWVVPATAPPGNATVRVIYSGSEPPILLRYLVEPVEGTC